MDTRAKNLAFENSLCFLRNLNQCKLKLHLDKDRQMSPTEGTQSTADNNAARALQRKGDCCAKPGATSNEYRRDCGEVGGGGVC